MSEERPTAGEIIEFDEVEGKGKMRFANDVIVLFQKDPYGRFVTAGLSIRGLPEVAIEIGQNVSFEDQIQAGLRACEILVSEDAALEAYQTIETDGADEPISWVVEPIEDDEEIVLVPAGDVSPRPDFTTEYGETTPEEAYFLKELELGTKNLVACGYLTTPIRYGSKFETMGDAFRAQSAFLALTNGALHLVHTRTPATSKPLLENKGTQVVARHHIFHVTADGEALVLDLGHESLAFEPKLENKYFPSQRMLIEGLLALDESAPSIKDLEGLRLRAKLKRWWPLAMAFVIVAVVLILKELEIWI